MVTDAIFSKPRLLTSVPVSSLLSPATPCVSTTLRFCRPFVFILLQIPFPATPFLSHPYKTPGGVGVFLPGCSRITGHESQVTSFHLLAASLSSLCALFCSRSLFFQELAASFAKTPGWGGGYCD